MPTRAARARADELLDRFQLTEAAGRFVRTYSGGMQRRLDVALGLVHKPRVLFLDEPTTGLDPESRAAMWDEITTLATADQVTVLLTTHYLDEADRLAGRVAIVDRGPGGRRGRPAASSSGTWALTHWTRCTCATRAAGTATRRGLRRWRGDDHDDLPRTSACCTRRQHRRLRHVVADRQEAARAEPPAVRCSRWA